MKKAQCPLPCKRQRRRPAQRDGAGGDGADHRSHRLAPLVLVRFAIACIHLRRPPRCRVQIAPSIPAVPGPGRVTAVPRSFSGIESRFVLGCCDLIMSGVPGGGM